MVYSIFQALIVQFSSEESKNNKKLQKGFFLPLLNKNYNCLITFVSFSLIS